MSHYEERLERDLSRIRERVADMADLVEDGVRNAIHALHTGNRQLAADTVLADHLINRTMRDIDRLCHTFIAVHLPSAGHLRLLSSVIRINIELERIGDYAVTIARETLHLPATPSGPMALELQRVGGETQNMLSLATEAFKNLNADSALSTMKLEEQIENNLDLIYSELIANDDREAVRNVLSHFAVFNQLKRIADQAKNVCEETVFAATGNTKAPKVYNVLFVDDDNSCYSQMAEAIARKQYPGSGTYTSGGLNPAREINSAVARFLDEHGVNTEGAKPEPLGIALEELAAQHIVVSLQGLTSTYFEQIPFHTTPLEWDVDARPGGEGPQPDNSRLEEIYREVAARVRDLMETLRGEGAP